LCERVGADVAHVRRGMGSDRRIGHHFLFPGAGYGGSCFPKDVQAIIRTARDHDLPFPLLNAVEDVNEAQKRLLADKLVGLFGDDLSGRRFAIWGLAFKPRTDDMREAPSIVIIEELLRRGAQVEAHDPEALAAAHAFFGDRVSYHRVNYDALAGADALVIVTDWSEFRRPDFARMRGVMKRPIIVDGRNLYEHDVMRRQGFAYYPIGRAAIEREDRE
jgi:UDPglucose 6-dehydrogenase